MEQEAVAEALDPLYGHPRYYKARQLAPREPPPPPPPPPGANPRRAQPLMKFRIPAFADVGQRRGRLEIWPRGVSASCSCAMTGRRRSTSPSGS